MPIEPEFAVAFAKTWIDGANARDFGQVLAFYAENVEVTSPYVRMVVGKPSGRIVGKARLREHWGASLTKRAKLKFALRGVFVGTESVVIHYINRGLRAAEVFCFDERKSIVRSDARYSHGGVNAVLTVGPDDRTDFL